MRFNGNFFSVLFVAASVFLNSCSQTPIAASSNAIAESSKTILSQDELEAKALNLAYKSIESASDVKGILDLTAVAGSADDIKKTNLLAALKKLKDSLSSVNSTKTIPWLITMEALAKKRRKSADIVKIISNGAALLETLESESTKFDKLIINKDFATKLQAYVNAKDQAKSIVATEQTIIDLAAFAWNQIASIAAVGVSVTGINDAIVAAIADIPMIAAIINMASDVNSKALQNPQILLSNLSTDEQTLLVDTQIFELKSPIDVATDFIQMQTVLDDAVVGASKTISASALLGAMVELATAYNAASASGAGSLLLVATENVLVTEVLKVAGAAADTKADAKTNATAVTEATKEAILAVVTIFNKNADAVKLLQDLLKSVATLDTDTEKSLQKSITNLTALTASVGSIADIESVTNSVLDPAIAALAKVKNKSDLTKALATLDASINESSKTIKPKKVVLYNNDQKVDEKNSSSDSEGKPNAEVPSDLATFTIDPTKVGGTEAPSTPAPALIPEIITTDSPLLSWQASTDPDGIKDYLVYWSKDSDPKNVPLDQWIVVEATDTPMFQIPVKLDAGVKYYFFYRSQDNKGNISDAATSSFTIQLVDQGQAVKGWGTNWDLTNSFEYTPLTKIIGDKMYVIGMANTEHTGSLDRESFTYIRRVNVSNGLVDSAYPVQDDTKPSYVSYGDNNPSRTPAYVTKDQRGTMFLNLKYDESLAYVSGKNDSDIATASDKLKPKVLQRNSRPVSIANDESGNIYVAIIINETYGIEYDGSYGPSSSIYAIVKINSDGKIDKTFGSQGVQYFNGTASSTKQNYPMKLVVKTKDQSNATVPAYHQWVIDTAAKDDSDTIIPINLFWLNINFLAYNPGLSGDSGILTVAGSKNYSYSSGGGANINKIIMAKFNSTTGAFLPGKASGSKQFKEFSPNLNDGTLQNKSDKNIDFTSFYAYNAKVVNIEGKDKLFIFGGKTSSTIKVNDVYPYTYDVTKAAASKSKGEDLVTWYKTKLYRNVADVDGVSVVGFDKNSDPENYYNWFATQNLGSVQNLYVWTADFNNVDTATFKEQLLKQINLNDLITASYVNNFYNKCTESCAAGYLTKNNTYYNSYLNLSVSDFIYVPSHQSILMKLMGYRPISAPNNTSIYNNDRSQYYQGLLSVLAADLIDDKDTGKPFEPIWHWSYDEEEKDETFKYFTKFTLDRTPTKERMYIQGNKILDQNATVTPGTSPRMQAMIATFDLVDHSGVLHLENKEAFNLAIPTPAEKESEGLMSTIITSDSIFGSFMHTRPLKDSEKTWSGHMSDSYTILRRYAK